MSKTSIAAVVCPRCQKSTNVTLWDSINVTLDPEMRIRVLDGSAFAFACPACDFRQDMFYPILYHDMDKRFMVWLLAPDDKQREKGFAKINTIAMPGYRLRVVSSLDRLREKILIFESQLDDRALELLKRYVWSVALEDHGIPRDGVFFSRVNMQAEYPEIELVVFPASGETRVFVASGKNGYPRAIEMLHKFHVPEQDPQEWKVVDDTYWALAEQGKG